MDYQFLKVRTEQLYTVVELNHPAKANAINEVMWFEIEAAFKAIDRLELNCATILMAQGKHFSSGIHLDFLKSIAQRTGGLPEPEREAYLYEYIRKMQGAFEAVAAAKAPVIAAIHGVCFGAGVDLVSACDLRLAHYRSLFSVLEIKLGIVADIGTLQRAPYQIPEGRLRELCYTSAFFKAQEAKCWGYVNDLSLTRKGLYKKARSMALSIAAMPKEAVQGTKLMLREHTRATIERGLEAVARHNAKVLLKGLPSLKS